MFRFQHPADGNGYRHQRRLGILGEGKRFLRPVPHNRGQFLTQRIVNLGKHLFCNREVVGKGFAHPHCLTALTGKNERLGHANSVPDVRSLLTMLQQPAFRSFWPYTHAGPLSVKSQAAGP